MDKIAGRKIFGLYLPNAPLARANVNRARLEDARINLALAFKPVADMAELAIGAVPVTQGLKDLVPGFAAWPADGSVVFAYYAKYDSGTKARGACAIVT